jgi:hypothetical protein
MSAAADESAYITLAQAATLLPGRPHVLTLARWAKKGVRGVKLEHRRFGRRICTTRQMLDAFAAALAAADCPPDSAPPSPTPRRAVGRPRTATRRQQDQREAEEICKRFGL